MNARKKRAVLTVSGTAHHLREWQLPDPEIQALARSLYASGAELDRLLQKERRIGVQLDGAHAKSLRDALREDHMFHISRAAEVLLKDEPGARRALKTPHKHASAETLLQSANQMAKAVRPYRALFIKERNLPRDFIARLRTAAKAFERWATSDERARTQGPVVRRALDDELKKARRIIRELDAYISRRYKNDITIIGVWKRAQRIPPKRGRPRRQPPKDPPTTSPA